MITVYGIKNCDTVKKARKWLEAQGLDYQFHDFRQEGLDDTLLKGWIAELGWESLLNKRSTSWRQLPDEAKNNMDEAGAIAAMLENPTLIKRPVLDTGDVRTLGFKDATYASLLGK
ncbi:MAG: ArsC family reductase [Pontibacterium sp.]